MAALFTELTKAVLNSVSTVTISDIVNANEGAILANVSSDANVSFVGGLEDDLSNLASW